MVEVPLEFESLVSLLRLDIRGTLVPTIPRQVLMHTPISILYTEGAPVHASLDMLPGYMDFQVRCGAVRWFTPGRVGAWIASARSTRRGPHDRTPRR